MLALIGSRPVMMLPVDNGKRKPSPTPPWLSPPGPPPDSNSRRVSTRTKALDVLPNPRRWRTTFELVIKSAKCPRELPVWTLSFPAATRRAIFDLVESDPGTGKTTMALQYLLERRGLGEPVLYLTLSETREELCGVAESRGWSLGGMNLFEVGALEERLQADERYTVVHSAEVELGETTKRICEQCQGCPFQWLQRSRGCPEIQLQGPGRVYSETLHRSGANRQSR